MSLQLMKVIIVNIGVYSCVNNKAYVRHLYSSKDLILVLFLNFG